MPYSTSLRARQRVEYGRSNRFLATLPPHDFSLLAPHFRTVALERRAILQDVGEEIERVYFLHSGMVSVVAVMPSGATVETATIGRAGVIGATAGLGARWAFARAIVQLPGTAVWLSAHRFRQAADQSPAIRDLVVRYNDLLFFRVQQSVACNALHPLEARVARWLLQTHDCLDADAIPLTQEILAQMLGVRRTTVTIAARLLQSAGLIRYRRGLIQIINRPALEDRACECYGVLRHNIDKLFPSRPLETAEQIAGANPRLDCAGPLVIRDHRPTADTMRDLISSHAAVPGVTRSK
jgi:CRP-like cAMP-binding protein